MSRTTKAAPKIVQEIEIVYPEFSGSEETQTDPFWISELNNAARGIFPKGVTYDSGGILTYKKIGRKITQELRGHAVELHNTYREFLMVNLGILSPLDSELESQTSLLSDPVIYETWTEIPKGQRREFVIRFVQTLGEDRIRERSDIDEVLQIIDFGVSLKFIVSEDFIMEDGRLVEIKTLLRNDADSCWVFDRSRHPSKRATTKAKSKKSSEAKLDGLIDQYAKFLLNIAKRTKNKMKIMDKIPTRMKESVTQTPAGTRLSVLTDVDE